MQKKKKSRLTDVQSKLVVTSGGEQYKNGKVGGTNYWM